MTGPIRAEDPALATLTAALVGRYRVDRKIGAGGMATVYLAHDERHDRNVAVKVLHEDLGATLGQERFLAEIKTTARLQHPHILPLLDSGSTDPDGSSRGLLYYVMPFVEGETLRDRLTRERQLPIDDALRIVREAGDALAYAHEHGIVHRDIKPENILLQGGHALVADFGIALAVQQAGGQRMTQTGLSLGTPQYMSPEQAMGEKSVDARTDQYALAAVLYEMLTGEPPFTGATVQAIVAKILNSDPEPPSTIRKMLPAAIEGATLTALSKLPADRFANITAFINALGDSSASAARPTSARARATAPNAGRQRGIAIAGLALGALIGVGAGWFAWHGRPGGIGDSSVTRSYVMEPPSEALSSGTWDFTFAPNGDLVYVGPGEAKGTTQLWRKRRSDLHATRISGTTDAHLPFMSPDGKFIAFFTERGLQRIAAEGGTPTTISADGRAGGRAVWRHDGRILWGGTLRTVSVPADGGASDVVVTSAQFAGYGVDRVEVLPGDNTALVGTCAPGCPASAIYTVDLVSKHTRLLIHGGLNPVYLPSGHVAWISTSGQLTVAPFDASSMTLRGEGRVVAEHVAAFEVSPNGDMMYREGDAKAMYRPVSVDRSGNASVLDSSWVGSFGPGSLSPDGKRYAISVTGPSDEQIWVKDMPAGSFSKFTFEAGDSFRPVWSADGRSLFFVEHVDSSFRLMEKRADGSGDARRVSAGAHQVVEAATSRDGWVAMRTGASDTSNEILGLHQGVDTTAHALASRQGGLGLAVSPDGHFMAYMKIIAGRPEVFVSPFPALGSARWQVSRDGGLEARWSHDGKELFFVTPRAELMAATVATSPTFAVVKLDRLFQSDAYFRDGGFHAYEPLPGDQRFLMLHIEQPPGRLVSVLNWAAEVGSLPQR